MGLNLNVNVQFLYFILGAKHLAKQAGTTPEERLSFQKQLENGERVADEKFIDAFQWLHPNARGHYSYWSQRASNRGPNKGLRLDYFIGSGDLFHSEKGEEDEEGEMNVTVRDCYMIPEQLGSDHCPIVLELEIKSKKG